MATLGPGIWPAQVHPLALLGAGLLSPKDKAAKWSRDLQQFRALAGLSQAADREVIPRT